MWKEVLLEEVFEYNGVKGFLEKKENHFCYFF
jgi:hypothetical protein